MDCTDEAGKVKHNDNPFIEPVHGQTVVDMKGNLVESGVAYSMLTLPRSFLDVMVLNDIIEQAAGRHSQTSDHGGKYGRHRRRSHSRTFRIQLLVFC